MVAALHKRENGCGRLDLLAFWRCDRLQLVNCGAEVPGHASTLRAQHKTGAPLSSVNLASRFKVSGWLTSVSGPLPHSSPFLHFSDFAPRPHRHMQGAGGASGSVTSRRRNDFVLTTPRSLRVASQSTLYQRLAQVRHRRLSLASAPRKNRLRTLALFPLPRSKQQRLFVASASASLVVVSTSCLSRTTKAGGFT